MMVVKSRQTKVLVALLISMIVGVVILRALGYNPPSAGAFCLSEYHRLRPVETIVLCRTAQSPGRWGQIEICWGDGDTDCHFIVCDGHIGRDGQILPTERWTRQHSVNGRSPNNIQPGVQDARAILICVIRNGKTDHPTSYQMKRTETLVLELCRRLGIQSESVFYPDDWW
jgi:hypothetical protein